MPGWADRGDASPPDKKSTGRTGKSLSMRKGRWQHLDRTRGERPGGNPSAEAPEAPAAAAPEAVSAPVPAPVHPAVQLAIGYFHLKQFEPCADTLQEALRETPELPGTRRWLGLALGRTEDPAGAVRELSLAREEDPDDPLLLASLISAHLQLGDPWIGRVAANAGPLGELSAASLWLEGQHLLRDRRPREAARLFAEAGERFLSASPPELVEDRLLASFVGQAISYLVAGELEAAQLAYSRLARRGVVPEAVTQFARQLYELADEARALPEAERREALGPLAELVLGARLRVRFYDPSRPVAMHWENLP